MQPRGKVNDSGNLGMIKVVFEKPAAFWRIVEVAGGKVQP